MTNQFQQGQNFFNQCCKTRETVQGQLIPNICYYRNAIWKWLQSRFNQGRQLAVLSSHEIRHVYLPSISFSLSPRIQKVQQFRSGTEVALLPSPAFSSCKCKLGFLAACGASQFEAAEPARLREDGLGGDGLPLALLHTVVPCCRLTLVATLDRLDVFSSTAVPGTSRRSSACCWRWLFCCLREPSDDENSFIRMPTLRSLLQRDTDAKPRPSKFKRENILLGNELHWFPTV